MQVGDRVRVRDFGPGSHEYTVVRVTGDVDEYTDDRFVTAEAANGDSMTLHISRWERI